MFLRAWLSKSKLHFRWSPSVYFVVRVRIGNRKERSDWVNIQTLMWREGCWCRTEIVRIGSVLVTFSCVFFFFFICICFYHCRLGSARHLMWVCVCVCNHRCTRPDCRRQHWRWQLLAPGRGSSQGAGQTVSVTGRILRLWEAAQLHVCQGIHHRFVFLLQYMARIYSLINIITIIIDTPRSERRVCHLFVNALLNSSISEHASDQRDPKDSNTFVVSMI